MQGRRTLVGKALKGKFVIADTGITVIGYFNGLKNDHVWRKIRGKMLALFMDDKITYFALF